MQLLQANVPKVFEAFIILGVSLALTALRWHFSSTRLIKLQTAFRFTWISQFYGMLLPGAVSADIAKGVAMTANSDSPCSTSLVASILLERFAGLSCLVIFGLFAHSLKPFWLHIPQTLTAVAALFGFLILVCFPIFLRLILNSFPQTKILRSSREIALRLDGKMWCTILAISFAIVATNVTFYWTVYLAVGGDANWIQMAIYTSIDNLAALLPVTVAGIGIRDSLAVALLSGSSDGTREVAFSWIVFFLMLIHGLVGFLLQFTQSALSPTSDIPTTQLRNPHFAGTSYEDDTKPFAQKS
jgi:uncharacterized membrane protein YbhN (UPF0104 family)